MQLDPRTWFSSTKPSPQAPSIPVKTPSPISTLEPSPPNKPTTSDMQTALPAIPTLSESPTKRVARQSALLFGGAVFLALSIATTRRSMVTKFKATYPGFYRFNNAPPTGPPANAAKEAIEALGLATMNTFAFGMMIMGGAMVATDISSLAELKQRFQEQVGEHKDDDEEMEEWMVSILARSEIKEKAKKVAQELEKRR